MLVKRHFVRKSFNWKVIMLKQTKWVRIEKPMDKKAGSQIQPVPKRRQLGDSAQLVYL